jgi:hypothetical protein
MTRSWPDYDQRLTRLWPYYNQITVWSKSSHNIMTKLLLDFDPTITRFWPGSNPTHRTCTVQLLHFPGGATRSETSGCSTCAGCGTYACSLLQVCLHLHIEVKSQQTHRSFFLNTMPLTLVRKNTVLFPDMCELFALFIKGTDLGDC